MIQQRILKPSFRDMRTTLDIGQGTAKRYLNAMHDEGLLRREGRKYCLAG